MNCKPLVCAQVFVSWFALGNGCLGVFPIPKSFLKKRKKPFSDAVIGSGGQSIEAPAD